MPEIVTYLIFLIALWILEILYFRIAFRYKIIDKPNERSSHKKFTIRGGGIIFSIACLLWFIYSGFSYPYFISGLLLIAIISFLDDRHELKSGLRSFFHILAVSLLLYQLNAGISWYWTALILIIIVGTINAYNFMDGINGITGSYSLLALGSLFYVNRLLQPFTSESLLVITGLSVLVFNFFNFRKKAVCFAGDVGSVSIAFLICFLLGQLMIRTGNLLYIGFLLLYGLDAVTTILFRLIRKENIFEAHRSHFYQFLANERGWPHLAVAGGYVAVQGVINVGVIYFSRAGGFEMGALVLICLGCGLLFVGLRWVTEGKERLMGKGVDQRAVESLNKL